MSRRRANIASARWLADNRWDYLNSLRITPFVSPDEIYIVICLRDGEVVFPERSRRGDVSWIGPNQFRRDIAYFKVICTWEEVIDEKNRSR